MPKTPLPVVSDAVLPALYDAWVGDALPRPLRHETRADCGDCPMVKQRAVDSPRALVFGHGSKCCTYIPNLPNFLVGLVLSDGDPSAVESMRCRMASASLVTPLGVHRTPAQRSAYDALKGADGFGRTPSYVCPHFQDGGCGIWQHRNAVCSTWFCKHVDGALGGRFWQALRDVLHRAEKELSIWCLEQLGLGASALIARPEADDAMETVETMADTSAEELWGPYAYRHEAFYIACGELVRGLAWSDVEQIGTRKGEELSGARELARERQALLSAHRLPNFVRVEPFECESTDQGMYLRAGFPCDPHPLDRTLRMPVLMQLAQLRGIMSPKALVERLEATAGFSLTHEQLRLLLRYGVLRAVRSPNPG